MCLGAISSVSTVAIPCAIATARSDDALLQQWKTIYWTGHAQGPSIAIIAGIVHGGIAYAKSNRGEDPAFSILAAAFTVGIVPYTWSVMIPTNNSLLDGANTGRGAENARSLVGRWRWMNGLRGALPMVGGILSLIGMIR